MSHLTVAASEKAFIELFEAVRDNFRLDEEDSADLGPFSASYDVEAHLEGGTVDLRDDNTISIRELDIKWDVLRVCLGIDIPRFCIPGFCIIPNPLPPFDCLVEFPETCVFSGDPDIQFCLDLSDFITSEISITASPVVKYRVDPARTPTETDLDAEEADPPHPNKWQIFIDPETVDIDVFDFADIVGDLLEDAITNAVDVLLAPLPQFVKDLIEAALGSIVDLVRAILDLPDDIGEFFSDLLDVSLGLLNLIATLVADYFANENPIAEFEDPLPILGPEPLPPPPDPPVVTLIPVKIPIRDLAVRVNTNEMIVEADVGAA